MATENKDTTLNVSWSIEHEGAWYGTDMYRVIDATGDAIFGTARFTDDERAAAEIAVAWINAYPQLVAGVQAAIDRLYRWHCRGIQGTDYGMCPVDHDCEQCSTIRGLQATLGGTNVTH